MSKFSNAQYGKGSRFVEPAYMGHYLIAFYTADDDDELVYVANNAYDLEVIYDNPNPWTSLSHFKNDGNREFMYIKGIRCIPHIIEMFDEDIGRSVKNFRKNWKGCYHPKSRTRFTTEDGKTRSSLLCDKRYQSRKVTLVRVSNGILHLWVTGSVPTEERNLRSCQSPYRRTSKRIGTRADTSGSLTESSSS